MWRSQGIKNRREFWFWGFVVRPRSRKWQPLCSVTRTLSCIREKTLDESMALILFFFCYNSFKMKEALKAGASHSSARHSLLYCDKIPNSDLGVTESSQPQRESTRRRRRTRRRGGEPNEKSTCDTSSERAERKGVN